MTDLIARLKAKAAAQQKTDALAEELRRECEPWAQARDRLDGWYRDTPDKEDEDLGELAERLVGFVRAVPAGGLPNRRGDLNPDDAARDPDSVARDILLDAREMGTEELRGYLENVKGSLSATGDWGGVRIHLCTKLPVLIVTCLGHAQCESGVPRLLGPEWVVPPCRCGGPRGVLEVGYPCQECRQKSGPESEGERLGGLNAAGGENETGALPAKKKAPKERVLCEEANLRVREWLEKHAAEDPCSVRREAIARDTGVSAGAVSNTKAWKLFVERRQAIAKPGRRDVQLSGEMLAKIPSDCQDPAMLAVLIEEQEKEREAEANRPRRHKRRHDRS